MSAPLLIGVSARIHYPGQGVVPPTGVWSKTVHYLEQSVAHWLLAGGALSLANTWRAMQSLSPTPYMSTLPMPALRLTGTVPSATLVQDLEPVARQLAERVKKVRQDDADESGEPDE